VKIDAGSHGVLESLPRLVDAASGSVYLRLCRFTYPVCIHPICAATSFPATEMRAANTNSLSLEALVLLMSLCGAA